MVSPQTALESKILVASCVGGQGIRLFAKGKGNYSTVQNSRENTEPNQKSPTGIRHCIVVSTMNDDLYIDKLKFDVDVHIGYIFKLDNAAKP